ncbi:MAG TPA: type IV secretion system DNA-binding domain-containing protein [Candidatus Acidoferrales bacterium]|nr:type IV secretion system DNA-binding domain-containing protein [Candidatus Acidoferrales bacterium]
MSQQWGRNQHAGEWPNPKPAWMMAALLLAAVSVAAIFAYRYAYVLTPLQRFYLAAYIRSGLRAEIGFKTGRYALLNVLDKKGKRLALDEEVMPVKTATGESIFALTETAKQLGDRRLEWQQGQYSNAGLHAFLGHWVYRDLTFLDFLRPALSGGLGVFIVSLLLAIPKDAARARARKEGRRLKGPELVTVRKFNRRNRSDGVGFPQTQTLRQRMLGRTPILRLPRAVEPSHILIMGDTGTGKSTLIRRILVQIGERSETAIIYDPALDYTPEFYSPKRGDAILNPLDVRMPYWSPGEELRHDAEALTLAASLFPDRHNENPFFVEGPRKIFAHLLTFRPTPEEMAWWMCHEEEIDRRVKGTEYAAMIDRQAPAQRSGVLASLNMIADTLKLLPTEKETTTRWSAAKWTEHRKGWLFLTSTPETRKRLIPLTSLWLDTLVLRLMNQGQTHSQKVWLVLDELASLQQLPQLHTAITENRKSNNPVVLGFQGRSQLETRYGHEAEAMLSQPATKIFLRTSEPRAAEWISKTIGEVEIERLRESRSSGQMGRQRNTKSHNLERQVEPLVMASEISGLADLHGYLKKGNLVVRMNFPFIQLPSKQPKYIERAIKNHSETPPTPTVIGATEANEQKLTPQEIKKTHDHHLGRNASAQQEHFFE